MFRIICHNSMLFLLKTISNYKIDGIYRQSQQYVGYIVAVSSFRCRKQRAQGENTWLDTSHWESCVEYTLFTVDGNFCFTSVRNYHGYSFDDIGLFHLIFFIRISLAVIIQCCCGCVWFDLSQNERNTNTAIMF